MVHRELCYAPLEGLTLFIGPTVGQFIQACDDGQVVGQPFVDPRGIVLVDGRCRALTVEVGLGIGGVDGLGPYQQLGRELLVLAVLDARCERQLTPDGLTEETAAG